MVLPVTFNGAVVAQLLVPDDTRHVRELMGQDEMAVVIDSPTPITLPINSYTTIDGWQYTINTIPSPKVGDDGSVTRYTYKITFEAPFYKLYDKRLRHNNNKTFSITGDLSEMAYLIVSNINEIDSGWSVGVVADMGIKQVDFDQHSCRTAMDKVAEAFGCEWYASGVDGKTLNFVKQVGNLTSLVLDYGRGNGLYELGFEYQSDKNIVTRAYGYGGSKNLPAGYRGGATQLTFDGFYLEKNVDLYRVKEGDYTDDDIYPTYTGTVGETSAYDADSGTFTITDSSINFDLNTYFSPDTPKVVFQSGQLMGQIFEISKYDHGTRTLVLNKATDPAGNLLPGQVVAVAVGDKYTLIDMYMPDEVVAAAEALLRERTLGYLNENCVPRVLYSLELDPLYMRDHGVMLHPGDQIRVKHAALGIDNLIRVTAVDYPASFPGELPPGTKITATIANFIPYSTTERVIADTIDNRQEIKVVNRVNAERARNSAANLRKLQGRIFNPDGSLFTGVNSLVAGMVSVGFESQNFNLNSVVIAANNGADPNALAISGGTLVHYVYKIEELGYTWALVPRVWTGLDPAKFYYVFAKCSTTSLTGMWEISETQVGVNDLPGYWAFNVGILYEVNQAGYRIFQSTKGITTIVGDQITSGVVQDITGQNYLNLNTGQFNLGDANSGLDWDVTKPDTLTVRGDVYANGGEIANFKIDETGLYNIEDQDSYIIQRRYLTLLDPVNDIALTPLVEASIGTKVAFNGFPDASGNLGIFTNMRYTGNLNKGLLIRVKNGVKDPADNDDLTGNEALNVTGDIVQTGGTLLVGGLLSAQGDVKVQGALTAKGTLNVQGGVKVNGKTPFTGQMDFRVSGGSGFATVNIENGYIVSIVQQ